MFRSPDQALAFAFKMRGTAVISIPSGTYIANKTDNQNTSDRLTKYDLHAQAGMIFSFLSRRPEAEQLYAFYLHGTMRERKLAAALMVRENAEQFSKYRLNKVQLRNAIFARSVRDVTATSGLSHHKAWNLRRDLADLLQPTQHRLMDALWLWLERPNSTV
jgi:hypothetical protein